MISSDCEHFDTARFCNRISRFVEIFFTARSDDEICTFTRELFSYCAAEAFARRADEGGATANSKIHYRLRYESDLSSQSCRGGLNTSTSSVSSRATALCERFD